MKNNMVQAPLLPAQWTSAFITYWSPMKRKNFISSGVVWFDYELEAFRIDGLFNPWDVEKTGYQLWMSEISLYGKGKNYRYTLPYYINHVANIDETFNYDVSELEVSVMDASISILPRDILVSEKATLKRTEKILGLEVDLWQFNKENPFNMYCLYLRKNSNELVSMKQFKNGQMLIRDFPNFSHQQIPKKIFYVD